MEPSDNIDLVFQNRSELQIKDLGYKRILLYQFYIKLVVIHAEYYFEEPSCISFFQLV